jgi:hypothetical protein
MLKTQRIVLLSATLIATGCGGGGGGGDASLSYDGPTALVVISSEADGDSIASAVVSSESTATVLSDAAATIPVGIATTRSSHALSLSQLGNIAKQYADKAIAVPSSSQLLAGVTNTQTDSCSGGGTVSFIVTKSVQNEVNAGDSFSITFNNCVVGSDLTNGSVSLLLSSYDQATGDFAASFTFSDLKNTITSSGDYVWLNGGYTAGFSGDGSTTPLVASLSGNSLAVAERTGGVVEKARLSSFSFVDTLATNGDFSFDHDYTLASTGIGGTITVTTVTPFTVYSGDSYPTVGQVVASGAAGASIRLTAIDNLTALIEYDLGGDGLYGNETIDPASKVVNWADF